MNIITYQGNKFNSGELSRSNWSLSFWRFKRIEFHSFIYLNLKIIEINDNNINLSTLISLFIIIQHTLINIKLQQNCVIHRLVNVPLSEVNFNKELNIIKQIAVNNGYNVDLIDSILSKKLHLKAIQEVYPTVKNYNQNYKTSTYFGSSTEKLASFLHKQDLKVAYRTNIKNNKDKTSKFEKSGV